MAASKVRPTKAAGAKKSLRGRMPVKRSINMVLVDEDKINIWKAIPGILLILVLAALFSKYLVADRLLAMSQASARTTQLQKHLDEAMEAVESFGEVEDTYAHYTLAGMTSEELSLVDRTQVLELVKTLLPRRDYPALMAAFRQRFDDVMALYGTMRPGDETFAERRAALTTSFMPREDTVQTWSVSGNLLTVEMTSESLQKLNLKARQLEQERIVDSCTITTANKDGRQNSGEDVRARFIVYLIQPPEEEVAEP